MIYLKGNEVLRWLGRDGGWYVVETPTGRYAVRLWQLRSNVSRNEIAQAARNVQEC